MVHKARKRKKIINIIVWVIICLAVSILGGLFSKDSLYDWYNELEKPEFTPPDWAFGVVWPVLYILMGISASIVWQQGIHRKEVKTAVIIFFVQLFLNLLWTPIFFGLHLIGLALVEITFLWCAIFLTIVAFWKVKRLAALLLIPYILWVTFAVVLNASLFKLNVG
jgi:tryptophan-rich sensory protein